MTGQLLLAAVSVIALVVAVVALMSAKSAQRRAETARDELQKKVAVLESELSAMMDGAFGVASQLQQVEMNLKDTAQRQEQIQQRDLGNLPYNEAVRLANKGASVEELVEQCGLSRSEAELVELLHKSSPPLVDVEHESSAPDSGEVNDKNV